MNRRGFLRMLGLGAAAVAAPTKAYSFLGGILRRPKDIVIPLPGAAVFELQMSKDMKTWVPYRGEMKFDVRPLSVVRGIVDQMAILTEKDVLDVEQIAPQARYLRVQQMVQFSQPNDPQSWVVRPAALVPPAPSYSFAR